MDDDEFPFDHDLTAFAIAAETSQKQPSAAAPNASSSNNHTGAKITQPTPRALPSRNAPSSIIVSPRQKGNPTLQHISALPWEYASTPADYVLGATTCALFISLKYHRLHPEYIYTRIRALAGKYNLRIMLALVDIEGHEEALRELAKTSLVNNFTLILAWSAKEAARYLELYKSYEYANPSAIRGERKETWADKMVEVVTTVRGVNRTDAVGLVSAFGTLRGAINAGPEEVAGIGGWGEKKVERWVREVRQPFRMKVAMKKGVEGRTIGMPLGMVSTREISGLERENSGTGAAVVQNAAAAKTARTATKRVAEQEPIWEPGEDEEEALFLAAQEVEASKAFHFSVGRKEPSFAKKQKILEPELTDGVAAALARLREH